MKEHCHDSALDTSRRKTSRHMGCSVGSANWRKRSSADERPPFHHRSYDKAENYIRYALSRPQTLILLTGEPGTGKTRFANELMSATGQGERTVARLACAQLSVSAIADQVAELFMVRAESLGREDRRQGPQGGPRQQPVAVQRPLLVVDNAQQLSPSALRAVCRLGCSAESAVLPLQVFLLGDPSLWDDVMAPDMRRLHKQAIAAYQLEPMSREEIRPYMQHCFDVGDPDGESRLSDETVSLIYEFSLGAPGGVNRLCKRLLTARRHHSEQELSATAVRKAVEALRQIEPADLRYAIAPAGTGGETADAAQGHEIWSPSDPTGALQHALADLQAQSDIEAAAILSDGGRMVAGVFPETLDHQSVAGLSVTLLGLGRRAATELKRGTLEEVIVRGEHGYALILKTGQDLSLLAITKPHAMLGLLIRDLRAMAKMTKRILCV